MARHPSLVCQNINTTEQSPEIQWKKGNCITKLYYVDSEELFLICFLFYKKPATAIAGPVIFSNGRVESPMKITRLRGFFFASGTITIQVGLFSR
jgi:hypothetical protein